MEVHKALLTCFEGQFTVCPHFIKLGDDVFQDVRELGEVINDEG